MTQVISVDARSGLAVEVVRESTDEMSVDRICRAASEAAPDLEALGRAGRAVMLRAGADALEQARPDIVSTADRETALGSIRLHSELTRTCYQLRLFADVLADGGYLEATIDPAAETAMGPRPDLRRMLVPIGPVAVFGASNFPLAFSVPGGDTASALAAGNPVVVKAHGAHPATSQLCFDVLDAAFRAAGAPTATLSMVFGRAAGQDLVRHPAIRAVGFTGSLGGGRALMRLIGERPDPIPFYGELSGINPVVITRAAAAERPDEIASGLVGSFTLGIGQFCTKPGLAFIPSGPAGDGLVETMMAGVRDLGSHVMLTASIATAFATGLTELSALAGVRTLAEGTEPTALSGGARPTLLEVTTKDLPTRAVEECFGPVMVIARYDDEEALRPVLQGLPPSLTATIHLGSDDVPATSLLVDSLRYGAGRLVFNGFPTGVAVSWAQHHGGPWPSTNTLHTSVGATAIRRFLRPQAWQSAPAALLPDELRDGAADFPRRVDGVLRPPSA